MPGKRFPRVKQPDSGNSPLIPADGQPRTNHLSGEKSPYLRQHANDPVEWYPWGDTAFAVAAAKDRPVFLSIGYSTCHWCHVMAEESFRDGKVARILNESFVCIKVDREERPDIDRVYMAVCQMMTGTGGWPLSLFLTPDRKPFYAATYIPREERFGRPGMLNLLPTIAHLWRDRRDDLTGSADQASHALADYFRTEPGNEDPSPDLLTEAYEDLVLRFDPEYGGFDREPKFPMPALLLFLLRYWKRTGTTRALDMVKKTLDAIRCGGIYDHLGGGIHRYSTDVRWRVPHFEKMLYDQALLAIVFIETFQATGEPRYRETAEDILAYLLRDLRSPHGGFFAAEDADSFGGEGAFYRWSTGDLKGVLGEEDVTVAQSVFNIPPGTLPGGDGPGSGSTLYRSASTAVLAKGFAVSPEQMAGRIAAIRERLFHARDLRSHPPRDEKVLADLNGLAIAALAKAAQVGNRAGYIAAAEEAAAFVFGHMRMPDGGIFHRSCCGEAAVPGFAEDYACMVFGLLELYEATFENRHLDAARALTAYLFRHFHDRTNGGFYATSAAAEEVLIRTKEIHDGVVPSANALILHNLLRLSHLSGDAGYDEAASSLLKTFSPALARAPSAHACMLCGLDFATGKPVDVVIAGPEDEAGFRAMVAACRTGFFPSLVVRRAPSGSGPGSIVADARSPQYPAQNGRATAYICTRQACRAPVTDPSQLLDLLNGVPDPV